MSTNELEKKVTELKELESFLDEINAQAEAIRSEIKKYMDDSEIETLEVGPYIIRWTSVLSMRFNSTDFKKLYADLYKKFTKEVASRRFSIA